MWSRTSRRAVSGSGVTGDLTGDQQLRLTECFNLWRAFRNATDPIAQAAALVAFADGMYHLENAINGEYDEDEFVEVAGAVKLETTQTD